MSIRKKFDEAKESYLAANREKRDTALQEAATDGDFDRAIALLDKGADINCDVIGNGWGPLHLAASNGHTRLVEELIARGAKVNKHAGNGFLPITAALKNNHLEIALLLAKAGSKTGAFDYTGRAPIHYAVARNDKELLRALLDNGADPNLPSHDNYRPLHRAIDQAKFEITKMLLEAGADPNAYDRDGTQALHRAAGSEQMELIMLVLQYGGELESESIGKGTPREFAETFGDVRIFDRAVSKYHSTRVHSISNSARKKRTHPPRAKLSFNT